MITWLILFDSCLPIASKILALNLTSCLITLNCLLFIFCSRDVYNKRSTINLQNTFKKCLSIQFNYFLSPHLLPKMLNFLILSFCVAVK